MNRAQRIQRTVLGGCAGRPGLLALAVGSMLALPAHADTLSYVTDFAKNNNIYANLNQQFPNTGPGVPGSGTGTPNASTIYAPSAATGAVGAAATNGASFELSSDANGYDFNNFIGALPAVSIGVSGVTTVYALVGAYDGQSFNVTFTAADGSTQSFTNVGVPDFNGGATALNACGTGYCEQTAFVVLDVGAGGTGNSSNGAYNNYDLTEVEFTLASSFAGQALSSASFSSNGFDTLLLGLTVAAVPEPQPSALWLAGLGLLGGLARRRRQSAAAR